MITQMLMLRSEGRLSQGNDWVFVNLNSQLQVFFDRTPVWKLKLKPRGRRASACLIPENSWESLHAFLYQAFSNPIISWKISTAIVSTLLIRWKTATISHDHQTSRSPRMKLGSKDMHIRRIAHRAIVSIRHLSVSDHLRRSNEGEGDRSCYVLSTRDENDIMNVCIRLLASLQLEPYPFNPHLALST